MITLREIEFKEFERDVYRHYKKIFPASERQSKRSLKEKSSEGSVKFVKILENEIDVGFLIYVTVKNNPYIWLDYFAIYEEYQNKNYGFLAIQALKELLKDYDGMYGEFEKEGFGISEEENHIRHKRANFWKRTGFRLLDIDLELYGIIYSSCVLDFSGDKKIENREILEYGFQLYRVLNDDKQMQKYCHILEDIER